MDTARATLIRWRKPSLLTSFGLLGAVPMALLAIALGVSLHRIIERRALESLRTQATYTASVGIGAYFQNGTPTTSIAQLSALRTQLTRYQKTGQLTGVAFWTPQGAFRFGSVPTLPGQHELARARAGEVVSGVSKGEVVVDVPVYLTKTATPTAVLRFAFPYALVSRQVAHDTRILYLIVLAGFVLLYAVLFPIVSRASRQLRRQSEENEHSARHDALTGLPNRMYFQELLERSDEQHTAAIVVDLDAFKAVNDVHGHHAGDELLAGVGKRLRETVRETDVVARMGGDEFAILVEGGTDERTVEALSQRIVEAIGRPMMVDGVEIAVQASVGAALPDGTDDRDELVKRADRAMYSAKRAGGGIHRLLGVGAV